MGNLSFGIGALGANLPSSKGSVIPTLRTTLAILHADADISIRAVSRIWITPAHPPGSGPDYANAVFLLETSLTAEALLARFHRIEADLGRDRGTGRWSARVLDIDLIDLDGMIAPDARTVGDWIGLAPERQRIEAPGRLILPHPRMQDRGFVLGPLAEIAPGWRHPLTGHSVTQMLADLGPGGLAGMQPMNDMGKQALP